MLSTELIIKVVILSVLHYSDVVYRKASPSRLVALNSIYHSALRFIRGDS